MSTEHFWLALGAAIVWTLYVMFAGYVMGRSERNIAWGDGYRAGWAKAKGCKATPIIRVPYEEREDAYDAGWADGVADACGLEDASSGAMHEWVSGALIIREFEDGSEELEDLERCPKCGGSWPECEGIHEDGSMGCTEEELRLTEDFRRWCETGVEP